MKTNQPFRFALATAFSFIASAAFADGYTDLSSVATAGRVYDAGGAFVTVFDRNGLPTAERVFLLNGGYPPILDAEPLADVWIFDNDFWRHIPSDAPAMAEHGLVVSADGRAWALGGIGSDNWLRSLATLTRFEIRRVDGRLEVIAASVQVPGPVPATCFGQSFVSINGGRSILAVGGACLGNPLDPKPGQLWEFSTMSNQWRRLADLPVTISNHSAIAARDYLWVFGGEIDGVLSSDVFAYDILLDSWGQVPIPGIGPEPRRDHGAVAVGNKMVVFGGIEEPFFPEAMDDCWQLDLDTLVWSEKAPLPFDLAGMSVATVPRQMCTSRTAEVLIYGGITDAWSFPPDLSNSTLIYTSDLRNAGQPYEQPHPTAVSR